MNSLGTEDGMHGICQIIMIMFVLVVHNSSIRSDQHTYFNCNSLLHLIVLGRMWKIGQFMHKWNYIPEISDNPEERGTLNSLAISPFP